MPDDALSSVPAPQSEAPTAHPPGADGAGTATNDGDAAHAARVLRASASAVDQHLSESKKSRGQRGPDKRPRKARGVPLESLGNGTVETPLEESPPEPLGGIVESQPAFDEETARTLVEISVGLLNDGASAIIRAIAKKETGDDKLAEEAAQSVRMSEKIETTVKAGGLACAKKYAVNMAYAPELMLGGGLVIWAGQVTMTGRALRAKGAELRQRAKEGKA